MQLNELKLLSNLIHCYEVDKINRIIYLKKTLDYDLIKEQIIFEDKNNTKIQNYLKQSRIWF